MSTPKPSSASQSRLPLLLGLLVLAGGTLYLRTVVWPPAPAPLALPTEPVVSRPYVVGTAEPTGRFTELEPAATGVDHVLRIDTSHPMKYLYFSGTTGGGVAVGDLDGDSRPDLFLVDGPGQNRVYRQSAPLKFEEMTQKAGIDGGAAWGTGVTLVDINNDGRLDIYVCNYDSPNELYINQGNWRFSEQGAAYGLNLNDASMQGTFADYDRDGDLDMYLVTYRFERPGGRPKQSPVRVENGRRVIAPDFAKFYTAVEDDWEYGPVARADGLLRNNGDGTFSDVSEAAQIRGLGHGLSATWCDFNNDGWIDIYVANDFMDADQLYRNSGDGTFQDVLVDTVPHTTWYSMGADVGDVNNDGQMDLLVADMSARTHYRQKVSMGNMGKNRDFLEHAIPRQYMRNVLLLGTGTRRMQEAAYLTGLADSDWTWTVKMADLDSDGRTDVYFTNGSARDFTNSDIPYHGNLLIGKTNWDLYENTPPRREKNLAFRNQGDLDFEDTSQRWGLDKEGISLAAAHADLDGDGDLDLVVANLDEPVSIYRNDVAQGKSLQLQLTGRRSNRSGVGARIEVVTPQGTQLLQLQPNTGFLASNEPLVHVGLGDQTQAERIVIHWPSGVRQELSGLAAGQRYVVVEPDEPPQLKPAEKQPTLPDGAIFASQVPIPEVAHRETLFDDYKLQPLLPNRLSQLGPCLAAGDADGDGDLDFYLGGAAGQPGTLVVNQSDARWERRSVPAWDQDQACEDLGAVWFDLEGDGDLDLYVVSGSYEQPVDSPLLSDRLYINDGGLVFHRAGPEILPPDQVAGSSVAAADWDRDGDLDLFVGARYIPGQYPLAPASRLLRNDAGRLVDATAEQLAAAGQLGMVTSAVWSDVNDDGWIDLLVGIEWGPIRCLVNEQGKLVDKTESLKLAEVTGWWNGIEPIDVDHDGDLDYVVTNFGLNTKYHATAAHPALLYYGDFSGNGQMQLVEAEFEDETLFPVRGRSCSTAAMPHLAQKFDSFHSFATASLQEIYTPEKLEKSYRFAATELSTGVMINGGAEGFTFRPLPRIVQIAPCFGSAAWDVNGDRLDDLVLAQNFYSPQPETGRMDGGLGQLLVGTPEGQLRPIGPRDSGIIVPEDAKSVVAMDVNGDARRDLVIGINDGPPRILADAGKATIAPSRVVRLKQAGANPTAIGARLVARYQDGLTVARQLDAGDGYLSQGPAELSIAAPADPELRLISVDVRWPDGQTTTHPATDIPDGQPWVIEHPTATGGKP
ncbi:MAG: FG-GAP-like repeat-containing protein [Pirellulales bacterium]